MQDNWNDNEGKPKGKGKPGAFLRQYGAYIIVILVAMFVAVILAIVLTPTTEIPEPVMPPRPATSTQMPGLDRYQLTATAIWQGAQ
jgi:hypothetical protein